MFKECKACNYAKPVKAFNKHCRTKDGYQTQCRECLKAARNRWEKANPEKNRARKLKSKYGLSTAQYNEILRKQGNKCRICKSTETRNVKYKFFVVDHCHATGKIRGLLCDYCNVALGRFEDDINRLKEAIKYLRKAK